MCCATRPGDHMQNTGRRLLNSPLDICFRLNCEPWDRSTSSLAAVRQIWQLTVGGISSVSHTPGTRSTQGLFQSNHHRQCLDERKSIEQTSFRSTKASHRPQEHNSSLTIHGLPSGALSLSLRWTGRLSFHTSNPTFCGSTPENGGQEIQDKENTADEVTGTKLNTDTDSKALESHPDTGMSVEAEEHVEKSAIGTLDSSIHSLRTDIVVLDMAQQSSPVQKDLKPGEEMGDGLDVQSNDVPLKGTAKPKEECTSDEADTAGSDRAVRSDILPCLQTTDTKGKSTSEDSGVVPSNEVSNTSTSNKDMNTPVDVLGNPVGVPLLPRKKKRKRSRPKIDRDAIKTNELGPDGHKMLPPEKLRVDTRESILKDLASSESKANGVNGDADGPAPGDEDSSTKEKEHEEKIVNGAPLPVESRKHEPVMLLMVGCQGSGKTKFAMDLVQYGAISWARINQDTLRGKAHKGLREECIVKARQLLDLGYCIVVDRMNFDHEQRGGFIALAKELGLTIHAVIFRLPFQDNVYNVATRTDHEGGFQGDTRSHKEIIRLTRSRLLYKETGLPKERDGHFSTLVFCESNEHYAAAFRQWVNYGRPMTSGQIVTMEYWRHMMNDKRMTGFAKHPTHVYRKEQVTPAMQEAAVGYVPGRDGPLLEDTSEEEADDSEDE